MKQFKNGSFNIELGQNASENIDIIRRSKQNDTWFHLHSFKGPHLVYS